MSAQLDGPPGKWVLYFALHTLFARTTVLPFGPVRLELPDPLSLRLVEVLIALVAAVLLLRRNWSVLRTLGVCALLGLASTLLSLY